MKKIILVILILLIDTIVCVAADTGLDDFTFSLPWALSKSTKHDYIGVVNENSDYCTVDIYEWDKNKDYPIKKGFFGNKIISNYIYTVSALCVYSSVKRSFESASKGFESYKRNTEDKITIFYETTNLDTMKTRILIMYFEHE